MKYDNLNPAAQRAIRRRMHYSAKRARAWCETNTEEHINTMVSQYYMGFGNMALMMKFARCLSEVENKGLNYFEA